MNRLMLLSYDDLLVLWDALYVFRCSSVTPGDPEFEEVVSLQERVGELLASEVDKMGNPKLK